MKTYRLILILSCISIFVGHSNAQIFKKLEKKIERKVNERIDRKIDQTIEKAADKVEEHIDGKPAKNRTGSSAESEYLEKVEFGDYITSKFDFIPGDKILFFDDFSHNSRGDFPKRWNTNASGEIVEINNISGKWLKIPDNTISFPTLTATLPQNFTIEFNLYYRPEITRPPITFGFTEVRNPAKSSIQHKKIFYFHLPPTVKNNVGYSTSLYSGRETTQSWPTTQHAGQVIHVSIAVNKSRMRLYMDNNKIFDLPNAFEPEALRQNFHFRAAPLLPVPKEGFYIQNIRIAEVEKDVRTQLIQTGNFSTSGIYFESGSATLKPESIGIIKEIADVLTENLSFRVIVIGHTDKDGTSSSNQELSLKRAEAVKIILTKSYAIQEKRIKTKGKGATEAVGDNNTEEGKAQNRRVEFSRDQN